MVRGNENGRTIPKSTCIATIFKGSNLPAGEYPEIYEKGYQDNHLLIIANILHKSNKLLKPLKTFP